MTVRIEEATVRHARLVAQSMRPRDIEEVRASLGLEPFEAIRVAMTSSYFARTLFIGLEPLALYGLSPLTVLGGAAQVWIFSTRAIDMHRFAFARASRRGLEELYKRASLLTNLVEIGDEPVMRWLEWLGGTYVLPPQPRGGRLFQQFILDRGAEGRKCRQA